MTIKNFEVLKQQLKELHPILNAFKSEAVQLRIVELIWGDASNQPELDLPGEEKPRRRCRGKRSGVAAKSNGKTEVAAPEKRAAFSIGPGASLLR